eukprot:9930880-Alexandrium_andersonii.AAC.1
MSVGISCAPPFSSPPPAPSRNVARRSPLNESKTSRPRCLGRSLAQSMPSGPNCETVANLEIGLRWICKRLGPFAVLRSGAKRRRG